MKRTKLATLLALIVAGLGQTVHAEAWEKKPIKVKHSEKQIEPGVWKVAAWTNSSGAAQFVAAYRAAEIISGNGFTYVQIINQKGKVAWKAPALREGKLSDPHDFMEVTVRGSQSAMPPTECRAKMAKRCMTVPAAALMARFASQLPPGYLANR